MISNGSPSSDDPHRRHVIFASPIQEIPNAGNTMDVNDYSGVSIGDKRKKEGRQRSRVWNHFTKLIKEDGSSEKCKCNHCLRIFTSTNKSGTTHLLRHITDGICPAYKTEKREVSQSAYGYIRGSAEYRDNSHPWKYNEWLGQSSSQQAIDNGLHSVGLDGYHEPEDNYEGHAPCPTAIMIHPASRKAPRRPQSWMNDLGACVSKLVELIKERDDFSIPIPQMPSAPDYSLHAAVKCLNEMEDIPQSSEMYLDAFEILKDAVERECFICLSKEPRRRWLQRMLQRLYPVRYTYDTE